MWYLIIRKRQREAVSAEAKGTEGPEASPKKISKKSKKPLDKSKNLWYNTDTIKRESSSGYLFKSPLPRAV